MRPEAVIHVIDDDEEVRRSLAFLLASAGFDAVLHDSAVSFLDVLPRIDVGCVVTDVRMPQISGIDLLKQLREQDVSLPVIVMTGHGDLSLAVEAMRAGALDFLEKPFDGEVLLATVQVALGGPPSRDRFDDEEREYRQRFRALSERERAVLAGLVAGHPNKVIAQSLGVSPDIVEMDRAQVMTKMNAASLSRLVRMAMIIGPGDGEGRSGD